MAKFRDTVELEYERSTKGTHLFKAPNENASVKSLYVSKTAMLRAPDKISITIEGDDYA